MDRIKYQIVWGVAGFFVVVAFGIGITSMAAFQARQDRATAVQPADEAGTGRAVADVGPYDGPAHRVHDAALAPLDAQGLREVTFEITEEVLQVAPDRWMELWTFGGTVPGPSVRVRQGDMVRFTLVNKGRIAHSIDFHAAEIAPNRAYRSIGPGESISFDFEAKHAGVFMYHCGTPPVIHHIGNGMYGMLIVEPRGLVRPPAREYALVQSELYFDGQGKVGSVQKMNDADPDWVVWNGYAGQYLDAPLVADPGERVRVYVLNAGPSIGSAFHVIGTIFDDVWLEGTQRTGPSQTVAIAPSQGAVVEFSMEEEGVYPFLTHAFADAAKGAIGAFRAGNPPASAAGDGHGGEPPPAAAGGFTVASKEMGFEPARLEAKAGDVPVTLHNKGVIPHDFTVEGAGTVAAGPGQTKTADWKLEAGTYTFYCSIVGHREAGMEGTLVVK